MRIAPDRALSPPVAQVTTGAALDAPLPAAAAQIIAADWGVQRVTARRVGGDKGEIGHHVSPMSFICPMGVALGLVIAIEAAGYGPGFAGYVGPAFVSMIGLALSILSALWLWHRGILPSSTPLDG